MKVRTFTAPSITAALAAAREALGDDVVLLESVPPEGGQPARVTVMVESAPRPAAAPAPARVGYGYAAAARPAPAEPSAAVVAHAAVEAPRFRNRPEPDPADAGFEPGLPARYAGRDDSAGRAAGRGRLFPPAGQPAPRPEPAAVDPVPRMEKILEAQLALLHDRMDRLERGMNGALIGAAQRWTAHPLFAALLESGMRPATATRLFESLAASGYDFDADETTLRWALAQELRRLFDVSTPKRLAGTVLFMGPAGAGKTTLLLKAARHQAFFGRRQSAVISVLPAEEDEALYHNPTELFRQFGLPVQTVRSEEEMTRALERVAQFDQVLIDTPPMPMRGPEAHRAFWHIRQIIAPVVPVEIHFVMNCTRALEGFDADFFAGLPVRPDAVALTHLDETEGWGRVADWILQLKLPVRFASTSRRVPDGLVPFSPGWFIEEMMEL